MSASGIEYIEIVGVVTDGELTLAQLTDLDAIVSAELKLRLAEYKAEGAEIPSMDDVKDTLRLDFLINNQYVSLSPSSPKGERVIWDQSNGLTVAGRGPNARAAIDDAMERMKIKVIT